MSFEVDGNRAWIVSLAAIALVVLGAAAGAVAPTWLGWDEEDSVAITDLPNPGEPGMPEIPELQFAVEESMAPDASDEMRYAEYERIVVDIFSDGSLRVLGDRMEMTAFKSLLEHQLAEQLKTVVAIRPAADCIYQHIGSVISVCKDFGVPHQMEGRLHAHAAIEVPGERA